MAKRKTHQQFVNEVNSYERGKNFDVLTEYVSSHERIEVKHKRCSEIWHTTPTDFIAHLRKNIPKCRNCKKEECKVKGCGNAHLSLGYCSKHYAMFKIHGDPEKRVLRERKRRTEKTAIYELLEFYKENGEFSSSDLQGKNSGLERYLRIHHEGLRGFCKRNNIEYILLAPKITRWTDELIYTTIKGIYLKYKKPVGQNLLTKEGVGGLYQWITKTGKSYKEYCQDNNLLEFTSTQSMWSDAKCFRLIKEINKYKEIKPNAEYIKKYRKGAHNYLYSNYKSFEDFVFTFDLDDFVDLYSNMSTGEKEIEKHFKKNKLLFTYQHKEDDCKNINPLPFDFSINNEQGEPILFIEFDGEQHFRSVEAWGGEGRLEYIQKNDLIKDVYCKQKNIPLIRIPFWKQDEIDKILESILSSYHKSSYLVNSIEWTREKYMANSPFGKKEPAFA